MTTPPSNKKPTVCYIQIIPTSSQAHTACRFQRCPTSNYTSRPGCTEIIFSPNSGQHSQVFLFLHGEIGTVNTLELFDYISQHSGLSMQALENATLKMCLVKASCVSINELARVWNLSVLISIWTWCPVMIPKEYFLPYLTYINVVFVAYPF